MTLTWIAALALGGLILALIIAPALDVRLSRRVANPIVIAALLLALALAMSNAAAYADDPDARQTLAVLSGILIAAGVFVVVLASARFAAGDDVGTLQSMAPRPPGDERLV
jgi:hypothetical protein